MSNGFENVKKDIIKPPFEIVDHKEALHFIEDQYSKGVRPIVTVPRQYVEYLKQGLKPYTTWVGIPLIAATFGCNPYFPKGEDRVVVKVDNILMEKIKPRYTGPKKAFSGVVVLEPPIPPEAISYEA
jgi:hypothetical protein